jgi:hypothetical protein
MKPFIIPAFAIILSIACANASSPGQKVNLTQLTDGNMNKNEKSQLPNSGKPVSDVTFDFEKYPVNQLPLGWSQYYSGSGGTDWKVTNDQGNKVLAQLYSENPNGHFNIIVNDSLISKDMELSVRLKGVAGKHDQGGGFVWRFADKNNYYVVRANPLEDNVVLYKVENGNRTDLPIVGKGRTYGVSVDKLGNGWNTLTLKVKGDLFTVFLNGKELFKVQDSTFPNAGKVGFWTKADAQTYFDDFKILHN